MASSFFTPRHTTQVQRSRVLHRFVRHIQTSDRAVVKYMREMRSKNILIWSCIAANGIVFTLWTATRSPASTAERRRLFDKTRRDLHENFLLSVRNVREGRWWTMLTSAFSHIGLGHFLFNMIAFHQFSQLLVVTPGLKAIRHFGTLIVGSALAGSAAFLSHDKTAVSVGGRQVERSGLGFSGVVSGVATALALLHPYQRMLLMGVVPVPLWLLGIGYVAYDSYAMENPDSTVAHDAHLGGAIFGAAYYMIALRRFGGLFGKAGLKGR